MRHMDPGIEFLLGGIPDYELGNLSGIPMQAIRYRRIKLGIPACGHLRLGGTLPPEVEFLLGGVNDKELSELSGIGLMRIIWARRKRGIPISGVNRTFNGIEKPERLAYEATVCEDLMQTNSLTVTGRNFKMTRERIRQIAKSNGMRRIYIWPKPGSRLEASLNALAR